MELSSLEEYLAQYEAALRWLAHYGVKVKNTRLERYARTIRDLGEVDADLLFSRGRQPELLNSLYEASEIIEVATIDEGHLSSDAVIRKLRTISCGQTAAPRDSADPARDHLLEFTAAAALTRSNSFGGFSPSNGDVQVLRDGQLRPGECKRASSAPSIRTRLKTGLRQLRTHAQRGQCAGVIILDISVLTMRMAGYLVGHDEDDLRDKAESAMTLQLVKDVMTKINVKELSDPSLLGVVARCKSIGLAGGHHNVRRSTHWQGLSVHADGTAEDNAFVRLLTAFGGEVREGTRKELVDASRKLQPVSGLSTDLRY